MGSRFVSAGNTEVKAPEGLSSTKDDAWEIARKQVEEAKKPARNEPAPGTQADGKSLYEHLQDQKAAKQEAFEEASKVKNQFRPLDDNEVEFLESVKQRQRSEAASVRKETAEQLEAFRKERAAAEELAQEEGLKHDESVIVKRTEDELWTTTKKRRRRQADEVADNAKARKTSPADSVATPGSRKTNATAKDASTGQSDLRSESSGPADKAMTEFAASEMPKPAASSLVTYDSDSDG